MINKIAGYFSYILIAVFVGACVVSTVYEVKKHQAIAYDFDYGYFAQIATKLSDAKSARIATLVPIGANMFGLGAFEGVKGFDKTIHFELMKYFPAVIYFISGQLWLVFLAVAAVYFSPLVYLLAIFKNRNADEKKNALIYGLLYAFSPAVLATVSFDLRPFLFFTPFILFLFLAVYYRRNFWEILIFFNLLFLVREEALVFAAFFIIYYFFRYYILEAERPGYVVALAVNWLVWAGIVFVFMKWSGYGLTDKNIVRWDLLSSWLYRNWAYLLAVFAAICISGFRLYQYLRPRKDGLYIKILNDLMFVGALSLPIIFGSWKKMAAPKRFYQVLYFQRFSLIFPIMLLIILMIVYSYLRSEKQKKWYTASIAALTGFMLLFNFLPVSEAAVTNWHQVNSKIGDAQLVWDLKSKTDKYNTVVLADQPTVEAFYDFEHINIFPCSAPNDFNLVQRDEPIRCYPGNEKYLVNLIKDKVEYIVVTKNSLPLVSNLMLQAQVKALESKTNDTYAWIRLAKKK